MADVKSKTITRDGYSVTFLSLPCTCSHFGARVPCVACKTRERAQKTLDCMIDTSTRAKGDFK